MAKGALLFVVALVGGIAGAAIFSGLSEDDAAVRGDRGYDDRELRAEIASLRDELRRARSEGGAFTPDSGERGAGIGDPTAEEPEAGAESAEETARKQAEAAARQFTPAKYVAALKGKKFTSRMRDRLITTLSLYPDKIDGTIDSLLAAVEEDPENADLQTALASAYTAKTAFGNLQGPAQGIPFMKAIAAYDQALALDPEHWTARFGKAFDTSMAPEFIGLRPAAIKQFEDLLQRQESRAPEPQFVQTYMRLGTLYKDAGNTEKARTIWKRGLEQFPDARQLREALAVIESK